MVWEAAIRFDAKHRTMLTRSPIEIYGQVTTKTKNCLHVRVGGRNTAFPLQLLVATNKTGSADQGAWIRAYGCSIGPWVGEERGAGRERGKEGKAARPFVGVSQGPPFLLSEK